MKFHQYGSTSSPQERRHFQQQHEADGRRSRHSPYRPVGVPSLASPVHVSQDDDSIHQSSSSPLDVDEKQKRQEKKSQPAIPIFRTTIVKTKEVEKDIEKTTDKMTKDFFGYDDDGGNDVTDNDRPPSKRDMKRQARIDQARIRNSQRQTPVQPQQLVSKSSSKADAINGEKYSMPISTYYPNEKEKEKMKNDNAPSSTSIMKIDDNCCDASTTAMTTSTAPTTTTNEELLHPQPTPPLPTAQLVVSRSPNYVASTATLSPPPTTPSAVSSPLTSTTIVHAIAEEQINQQNAVDGNATSSASSDRKLLIYFGGGAVVGLLVATIVAVVVVVLIGGGGGGGRGKDVSPVDGSETSSSLRSSIVPTSSFVPTVSPTTSMIPSAVPTMEPTNILSNPQLIWTTLGTNLQLQQDDESNISLQSTFGTSIALSSNGYTIAIGAPGSSDNNLSTDKGMVQVYQYNTSNDQLSLKGSPLVGNSVGDEFGFSVAMNGDGTIVAVGSVGYDSSSLSNIGCVQIYQWNDNTNDWIPMGSKLVGNPVENGYFGRSIALSLDGHVVAVGAASRILSPSGSLGILQGYAKVFQWNKGENDEWIQMGDDIVDQDPNGELGYSIDISDDGRSVVVGSARFLIGAGGVQSFHWSTAASESNTNPNGGGGNAGDGDFQWIPSERQPGEIFNEGFASFFSLSGSGRYLAVGSETVSRPTSWRLFEYMPERKDLNNDWIIFTPNVPLPPTTETWTGTSVSVVDIPDDSDGGLVLAMGGRFSSSKGYVSVSVSDGSGMPWNTIMIGEEVAATDPNFGSITRLSRNGKILAVGSVTTPVAAAARDNTDTTTTTTTTAVNPAGYVTIYKAKLA